jgi:ribosomal protein S27AE
LETHTHIEDVMGRTKECKIIDLAKGEKPKPKKCPKCGSEMRETKLRWYCMTPECGMRSFSKDGLSQEVYCGHEWMVKQ